MEIELLQAAISLAAAQGAGVGSSQSSETSLTSRFRRRERMMSPKQKSWPASDLERSKVLADNSGLTKGIPVRGCCPTELQLPLWPACTVGFDS